MIRSALMKTSTSLPTPVVDFIQVVISLGVAWGVTQLSVDVGHLSQPWFAIYGAATALYYAAISAAEKKWPTWAWLLYLLPTQLPEGK